MFTVLFFKLRVKLYRLIRHTYSTHNETSTNKTIIWNTPRSRSVIYSTHYCCSSCFVEKLLDRIYWNFLSSSQSLFTPSIIFWTSSTSEYPSLCLLEIPC